MSRLIAKNDIFEVQRILMRSEFRKPTFMPGIVDSAHKGSSTFYLDRITSASVLRLETILLSEEKEISLKDVA